MEEFVCVVIGCWPKVRKKINWDGESGGSVDRFWRQGFVEP